MSLRKIFMKAFERALELRLPEAGRWEEALAAVVAHRPESAIARAVRHGLSLDVGHRTTTTYVAVRPKDETGRMWRRTHSVYVHDDDMPRTIAELEAEAHRVIDIELGLARPSDECVAQNCGCAQDKMWNAGAESS
jgi:hypothetical protein